MREGFENRCNECGHMLFEYGDEKPFNYCLEVLEMNGTIISRFCSATCLRYLLYHGASGEWIIRRIEKQ